MSKNSVKVKDFVVPVELFPFVRNLTDIDLHIFVQSALAYLEGREKPEMQEDEPGWANTVLEVWLKKQGAE